MPKPLLLSVMIVALLAGALGIQFFVKPSLEKRAMAAYKAGDYTTALPLFIEWSQTPAVQNNTDLQNQVLQYTAISAYQSHEYTTALPLFKKWANIPSLTANAADLRKINAYILLTQQQITMQTSNVTPANPSQLINQTSVDPSTVVIPMGADRIPHKPMAPGELRPMLIKELGNFDYDADKGGPLPADVMALNGAHIKLRGFMLPLSQAASVTEFALVPSLFGCCFGQPPGVQHVVTCHLPNDKGVDAFPDEVWVEGTLRVEPKKQDGYTYSLFELDSKSVKPTTEQ